MKYSQLEIGILKEFYPPNGSSGENGCRAKFLKIGIDRTIRSINQKARKLGIAYLGVRKGAFKKGAIPHNKGKAMSKETYNKVSKTMFKKGNQPHNTKFDGALSWRKDSLHKGYWHIRISKAKWILLHRHLYEKAYGITLSKCDVVRFIDGNSKNLCIDNLELMSRTKNLFKNNPRLDYPEYILDVMIAINKLNKKVKILKDGTK